jgi:hypothetical protein
MLKTISLFRFLTSAVFAAALVQGTSSVAQNGARELQDDYFYPQIVEHLNLRIFISPNFSCEKLGQENEFFILFEDEIYNSDVDRVFGAVWKSLLVFTYEKGQARCLFKDGQNYRFKVISLFDDEEIVNTSFDVTPTPGSTPGAMFSSEAAMVEFRKVIVDAYRPIQ